MVPVTGLIRGWNKAGIAGRLSGGRKACDVGECGDGRGGNHWAYTRNSLQEVYLVPKGLAVLVQQSIELQDLLMAGVPDSVMKLDEGAKARDGIRNSVEKLLPGCRAAKADREVS